MPKLPWENNTLEQKCKFLRKKIYRLWENNPSLVKVNT